jgi:hypothetical protein
MANFADTEAGFESACSWARAKVEDKTWIVAHAARDMAGHPICRFIRPMSPTNPGYGAWVTSRADDAT